MIYFGTRLVLARSPPLRLRRATAAAKSAVFDDTIVTVAAVIIIVVTAAAIAAALGAYVVPEIVWHVCGAGESRSAVKAAAPSTDTIDAMNRMCQSERAMVACAGIIFPIIVIISTIIAVCAWFIRTSLASVMPGWFWLLAGVDSATRSVARPACAPSEWRTTHSRIFRQVVRRVEPRSTRIRRTCACVCARAMVHRKRLLSGDGVWRAWAAQSKGLAVWRCQWRHRHRSGARRRQLSGRRVVRSERRRGSRQRVICRNRRCACRRRKWRF